MGKKGEGTVVICFLIPVIAMLFAVIINYIMAMSTIIAIKHEVQQLAYDCVTEMETEQYQTLKQENGEFELDEERLCEKLTEKTKSRQYPITNLCVKQSVDGRAEISFLVSQKITWNGKEKMIPVGIKATVYCEGLQE